MPSLRQQPALVLLIVLLLVGVAIVALFGLWWMDPAAALFIAAVATKEGRESWRGDGCCDAC
jgi:divalent metal cation (Fe/Co/Zn/Cd) transporter